MRTLKDHLPHEFVGGEYVDTPAYKLRDIEVTVAHDNRDKPWPGPQKSVTAWYILANGKAVAWNENAYKGWSFPVINYVADNEVTFRFIGKSSGENVYDLMVNGRKVGNARAKTGSPKAIGTTYRAVAYGQNFSGSRKSVKLTIERKIAADAKTKETVDAG